LLTPSAFSVHSKIIEIQGYQSLFRQFDDGIVMLHQNLLCDRSPYFRKLVENAKIGNQSHLTLGLSHVSQTACSKFARWLYGQPLCLNNLYPDRDLRDLAEIYHLNCVAEAESGTRDNECVDACLHAMKHILAQKSNFNELDNPIELLEKVFLADDKYPGRAFISNHLVHGECATDGRTMEWINDYCLDKSHKAEVVQFICREFAKKACGQSQGSSSTNSAGTAD